ncbi:unnamed protein product [Ilex paraguariensis]|uniref:Cytochrome P450 n=1 Tax=Ilex paraguariensis TaxID=185542 RepID=A0ABC8SDX3_9AQUA
MAISYYVLLFAFLYYLTKHFLRKFQNLTPNPYLSLPIIGHLYLFKKPLHRSSAKISNQYGPVQFLQLGSRPVLLVSSPSAAEECFTKNDIVFANRPALLAGKHLGYNYTTLVWASYGHQWRNLRRIATLEILSTSRIQMFSGIRSQEVHSLIGRLFRGSSDDEYHMVAMKSAFLEMILNIMMQMIAGKRYYSENSTELEETRKFKEILTETFLLSGTNIGDFLPILKWVVFNGIEKRLKVLQEKRDKFMQDLIEEHRRMRSNSSPEQRNKTMIDVLLSLQETEPEYCKDEIIRGIMIVSYVALSSLHPQSSSFKDGESTCIVMVGRRLRENMCENREEDLVVVVMLSAGTDTSAGT